MDISVYADSLVHIIPFHSMPNQTNPNQATYANDENSLSMHEYEMKLYVRQVNLEKQKFACLKSRRQVIDSRFQNLESIDVWSLEENEGRIVNVRHYFIICGQIRSQQSILHSLFSIDSRVQSLESSMVNNPRMERR